MDCSIIAAAIFFFEQLHYIYSELCRSRSTGSTCRRYPPQFSVDIIKIVRYKGFVRRKHMRICDTFQKVCRWRAANKRKNNTGHSEYTKDGITSDVYMFWLYINDRKGTPEISSTISYNKSILEVSSDSLNWFSDFFSQSNILEQFVYSTLINILTLNCYLELRRYPQLRELNPFYYGHWLRY